MYGIIVENNYISAVGVDVIGEEIDESTYATISEAIKEKPKDLPNYSYMLRADTLEWELVELPPAPTESDELTAEEALDILLGGERE